MAYGLQEALPPAWRESRPTTGVLGPSAKGLSNATQTAPEESQLEIATTVVFGAAASMTGALPDGRYDSTPESVNTTMASFRRATPPRLVPGRPFFGAMGIGGEDVSESRGMRKEPRETVPTQTFPLSSSTMFTGLSGRCASKVGVVSPAVLWASRSIS